MALHSVDPSDEMCERWDEWSRQSEKYEEGACRRRWKSFDGGGKGAGHRLGLGSLITWGNLDGSSADGDETSPLPWVDFPVDVLPEPLSHFVSEASAAIGCDPSFIALPALTMLASCIGTSRRIQLKRSWCEPAILWSVVVAESGTLKSPAHDVALEPIRLKQRDAFAEHSKAEARYEIELAKHHKAVGEWKQSGKDTGEEKPRKPKPPKPRRYLCSDTTVEALAVLLENNPRGLLLARDELGGWFRSFNAYKQGRGGDTEQWLEMHRAGHVLIDRKTADRKRVYVPRAAVSICGTIQPEALQRVLGREHFANGLVLQR